ncbi:MAG: cupin domain-containing protein [Ignavibacteriaceae bacterium]|nr:cupin domain-containing protein [Ignavibacteriaceae bacterium]
MKKLILALIMTFICTGLLKSQSINLQKEKSKQWTMENCVKKFSWEDTVQTKAGYQYWFFDRDFLDGRTIKLSVVAPNSATHSPHKHSEDEFFFVLEGTAEFYLEGETAIGEKYSAFYCPSNLKHGIRNIGDTELKYLVIKKYETK